MKIIGLIKWFRPYIKNLSNKLQPLTSKLSNKKSFYITDSDIEIVKNLASEIEEQPRLHFPDLNQPYSLHTDASDKELGGVLTQNQKVIGYYSYKLTDTEMRYSIVEKEMLAVVKSLLYFRNFIIGQKITVHSDNNNLKHINKKQTNRMFRWLLQIDGFDYEIKHISGDKNTFPDFLSRFAYTRKTTDYGINNIKPICRCGGQTVVSHTRQ